MLQLINVHVNYGSVQALKGINLTVSEGKIISLLGANGAGKSTTLKTISRLVQIRKGDYLLDGKSVVKEPPDAIVKKRVIHCPENRRVFPELTVEENLRIGTYVRKDTKKFNRIWKGY